MPARLHSGSAKVGNKGYKGQGRIENAFPKTGAGTLALKKTRQNQGARTQGDFERRGG